MARFRLAMSLVAMGIFGGLRIVVAAPIASDPAEEWLSVFAWVQTAERLAGVNQLALALAAYIEADRLLAELSGAHPGFEPEMVSYRKEALRDSIAGCEARLTDNEHGTMMQFLDFIESLEKGEDLRYENRYEEAHAVLSVAKALLEEIVEGKPEEFREAVAPQMARLDSSLTWMDSQINFRFVPVVPGPGIDQSIDWGTTQYLKESDLPTGQGMPGSGLFPGGSVAPAVPSPPSAPAVSGDEAGRKGGTDPKPPAPRRFRMSSGASTKPVEPGKPAD